MHFGGLTLPSKRKMVSYLHFLYYYVIPDKNDRDRLRKCLQDKPFSKLILKCYQPNGYYLV